MRSVGAFATTNCVGVSICQIRRSDTHAFVPTSRQAFLPNYCFPERKSFPPGTGEGGHDPHDMSPAPRSGQVGGYDFELLHQEGKWFFLNLAVIRQKSFVVSGF